jgi:hypothetical protein
LKRLGQASGRGARLFPCPMVGLRIVGRLGTWFHLTTGRSIGVDHQTIQKLCGSLVVDNSYFRQVCQWKPPFSAEEGLRMTARSIR